MVLVYLIWNHHEKKRKGFEYLDEGCRYASLSGWWGRLFVFLSFWLYKLVMSQNMDLSDVVFGKEKTQGFHQAG